MPFFGPRLDRPSAVGDEGRPRATSLTVASLTVLGLFVATGWVLGTPTFALGIGALVGLVAAGVGLQRRERLVDLFVGNLCLLGAGSLLVFILLGIATLATGGLALVGLTLSMLALALTWANVATEAGFREALSAAALSFVAFLGWLIGAIVALFAGAFLWVIVTAPTLSTQPVLALTVFGLAIAGAGIAVRVALARLPILQLTPRSQRDQTRDRLAAAYDAAGRMARGGVVLTVGVLVLAVLLVMTLGTMRVPIVDALGPLIASPVVVGVPVTVAVFALLAAGLATAVRAVAGYVDGDAREIVPAAAAGLVFLLVLPAAAAGLPLLFVVRPASVLFLIALGPLLLLFALALLVGAIGLGLLPDRAGGPALAAASLFLATIGAGLVGMPTPLVLAMAAGALLVWDVSTFGLGVTAELGHRPETRRLELFHGVLAVGVGATAVLVLSGVDVLRNVAASGTTNRLAAATAVAAVLLAVLVLRR